MIALSNRDARWLALQAQGLGPRRAEGRPGISRLQQLIGRIGTIQLDAVNVLERTQFLVPFSRLGSYDVGLLRKLSGPGGRWFEYWGHAASLLPVEWHPLFRWRMQMRGGAEGYGPKWQAARAAWRKENAGYVTAVLEEVRARGPLAASQLSDPRRRDGEWWGRRSSGRLALEWLFGSGELAAWRAPNFERIYDLTERVIPASVLAAPTPTAEDAQRALTLNAARSLGVATLADLADYFRIPPASARLRAAELVEDDQLAPVTVEGWSRAAYIVAGVRPRRPTRQHATLLSPFDSLIWYRDRTRRLFDFDYRIEIYVPEAERRHGYYVMPLLLGDELVARFDLKADRRSSVLRVAAAHLEPGIDGAPVADAAATELDALRGWLGLAAMAVGRRGSFAPVLRRAVG